MNCYILLYIWQLPQNILGLLVILFSKAEEAYCSCSCYESIWITEHKFGISLGMYTVVNKDSNLRTIQHEYGHQLQSLYLGPLYLLVIGLPSAIGNLLNRVIKFDYYKQPWEAWADKLGDVNRY